LRVVLDTCGGFFDVLGKEKEIARLEVLMAAEGFWNKVEEAQKIVSEVSRIKALITPIKAFNREVEDLKAMLELIDDAEDADGESMSLEIVDMAGQMAERLEELEIQSFLSGPMDHSNAIVSIHAGAGGTESCDWAEMMLRMYTRWAERRGFTIELDDLGPGEEAGISRATFRIIGENAYGYIKAERGVHRLVRISPFDSNKRRHTSFTAIDVIGEVSDDIEVEVREEDLRIDTYRSSGKGGQHVNRTDSAVRLTHLPTGIVVACQNERSQLKNKASAMKVLKSRIYERMQDEKRAAMEKFYGEKNEIGWGNQIRSYVFQPYQMVKDLRTGVETSNIQEVMDGDLDRFIHSWLRAGCPRNRNKDINIED
jgi:peptide chain release factor 2